MEKSKGIVNYVVRYNSDPRLVSENHKSDQIYMIDTDEQGFDLLCDAINFLSECTSPITQIEDLVPQLKNRSKRHKFLLPESHIKEQHQLTAEPDNVIEDEENPRWG